MTCLLRGLGGFVPSPSLERDFGQPTPYLGIARPTRQRLGQKRAYLLDADFGKCRKPLRSRIRNRSVGSRTGRRGSRSC